MCTKKELVNSVKSSLPAEAKMNEAVRVTNQITRSFLAGLSGSAATKGGGAQPKRSAAPPPKRN